NSISITSSTTSIPRCRISSGPNWPLGWTHISTAPAWRRWCSGSECGTEYLVRRSGYYLSGLRACGSLGLIVDLCRVEDTLGDEHRSARRYLAEEAAFVSFVAGGAAKLADFEENRVGVAVDEDGFDLLHIAALFSLAP